MSEEVADPGGGESSEKTKSSPGKDESSPEKEESSPEKEESSPEKDEEKPAPVFYHGIQLPEELLSEINEPRSLVYTDKSELMKVLKEYKGARFKSFRSKDEALQFSTSNSNHSSKPQMVSTPVPGESCVYKTPISQQKVKLRKAIEAGNLDYILDCIRSNPTYLMTPSDTPTILHEGPRLNALHVAAKTGRVKSASIILDFIKGDLIQLMYPEEEVGQNLLRQERILDLYINMPDKGAGDTPLHYASKFGMLEMVQLLMEQSQVNPELRNKNGERAGEVVCSRARVQDKEVEEKIGNLIKGLLYIPVYKEFEYSAPSSLGDPVAQKDWLNLTYSVSPEDLSSSSPRSPLTSRSFSSFSPGSPALKSPMRVSPLISRGSPMSFRSPHSVRSPMSFRSQSPATRSPVILSGMLGPVTQDEMSCIYKDLKVSSSARRLFAVC
jgi:hypothetical protein